MRNAFAIALTAVLVCAGTWRARGSAEAARILAVEPVAAVSHWNFMSAVLEALTNGGHNVTVFTPFPDGDRDNYAEVDLSAVFPARRSMDLGRVASLFNDAWTALSVTMRSCRHNCDRLHENRRFREIVARGPRARDFDAMVVERVPWDCVSYVAAELGVPLILAEPAAAVFLDERAVLGDVANPAAVPPVFADHAVPRAFVQRLANAEGKAREAVARAVLGPWTRTTDPKPYDSRPSVPPSLVFVNGHYASDAARPVAPNAVSVGGVHLRPVRKIPPDILEFIDGSSHDVIIFTFGSTVKMSTLPSAILEAFLEAIAQLPQRVLMKYEGEMENKPSNVLTKEWFPQRDILKHPKVKLFISHGGISGIYEAVDAGVPVLGFPLFWDQHRNLDHLVERGMASVMDVFSVTGESFLANILKIVNDQTYTENAKIASDVFKDRPVSPQQSIVFWTEYVIRHKGAKHLRSHGHDLTWYQYYLLDVLAVMFILLSTISFIIYRTLENSLKYINTRLCSSKTKIKST